MDNKKILKLRQYTFIVILILLLLLLGINYFTRPFEDYFEIKNEISDQERQTVSTSNDFDTLP